MKLEKAIEQLEFDRAMILFDPTTGEEIMPEILKALNEDNYRTYIADGVAIEALKEVQQYRAIGTVEECREAMKKQKHMNDGWILVSERLPEEKINPVSQDFFEYQVTAKFGNVEDVRHYDFGNGHWWHGPGIVDEYVVAWRENPEPYKVN